MRSPEQAAANASPPPRAVVTAAVELRTLTSTVVTRGDVVPAVSTAVTPPRSGPEIESLVTGVFVDIGDEVTEGTLVVEVSGRPVFVIEGSIPAFRPMRPGVRGADVTQLQAAFERLGCDAGASGVYDEPTKLCVERLYQDAGYDVVRSSDTEAEQLAEASQAVSDAEDELGATQDELAVEGAGPARSELVAATVAVAAAERNLATAEAEREQGIAEAIDDVDAAIAALNGQLVGARPVLPSGGAATGETADASLTDDASTSTTALDGLEIGSSVAGREQSAAQLSDAWAGVDIATRDGDNLAAAAQDALTAAEADQSVLMAAPDVSADQAELDRQLERVATLERDLDDLEAMAGATVPFGEVAFVTALPATVNSLSAVLGEAPSSPQASSSSESEGELPAVSPTGATPMLVLSSAGLQVEASVQPRDRQLLRAGMEAELLDELSGFAVTGELLSIGDELVVDPGGSGSRFEAVITSADVRQEWSGRNLRVTIATAATVGEVLVVPLAAVSSSAGGQTRVDVVRSDGSVEEVAVTAGLSADGFVAVTPDDVSILTQRDRVVVGR